jgi:SAM-dependent methyltransferase
VEFVRGLAHSIPLRDPFDLIIVNFVLHWTDRANLLRSVAEVDRLLVDGGFLIIGDFHPSNFVKVRYHHLAAERVFTYKQDYAATFLSSGLYHGVCLLTDADSRPDGHAEPLTAEAAEDVRLGAWLLRKMLHEHYLEAEFVPGEYKPSSRGQHVIRSGESGGAPAESPGLHVV